MTGRRWPWELLALGIALVAVLVRCLPWEHIFSSDPVVLLGTDPYYHLRRAWMLVEHFPAVTTFDAYLSFPAGAPVPWPPGFDFLVALPGLLGGTAAAVAGWGVFLMPLLGGLAVYLVYRLGMHIFDRPTALLAAVFMALMNGAMEHSILGRVDHHGLVAPVTLLMFLALLKSLQKERDRDRLLWGSVCGLLAAVSVASWIITPALYFLPVPLTLLLLSLSPGAKVARPTALAALPTAAVFVLLAVLLWADLRAKPFALYQPSWFTVVLFALAAVFVVPFYFRRMWIAGAGAVVAVLAVIGLAVPDFYLPVQQALSVLSGSDSTYRMVEESSHLFVEHGLFTFGVATSKFTYLVLLSPVILAAYLYASIRSRERNAPTVFAMVFFCLAVLLLFVQRRFGEFAAPALSLLFAWVLYQGARVFLAFARDRARRSRATVYGALLAAALAAALSPLVTGLWHAAKYDPVNYQRQVLAFGQELSTIMPPVQEEDGRPSYGIITGWNESHPLLYCTGIPVMVSSFGTREAALGNRRAFRLLLSSDEESAYRGIVEDRVRYVVVSSFITQLVAMTEIAGLKEPLVHSVTTESGSNYVRHLAPLEGFSECLYTRMFLASGTTHKAIGRWHRPLSHFRLVLETATVYRFVDEPTTLLKAFEVVAGARIAGRAEPGTPVQLQLAVRTNAGRKFVYRNGTTTGPEGRFEIVVPYPTGSRGAPVTSADHYLVKVGDEVSKIQVSDRQVREGLTVELPPPD